MSETELSHAKRKHRGRYRQLATVPPAQIDWSAIFKSLPQEPPKNFGDVVWNGYKKELWAKYNPDSLLAFEGCRMIARSPDMPDGVKLVANFLALLCGVDGYGATVEGLRKDQRRALMSTGIGTAAPRLRPAWPSLPIRSQ